MNKTKIVIHHTAVTQPDLNKLITSMNNSHKARFNRKKGYEWSEYVQYHFVIWVDGEVRKLAPLKEVLYHASNYEINQQSIGVVLSWNFDKDKPTQAQYGALLRLIWEYKLPVSYHRDYTAKTCPWNNFDYDIVSKLADNKLFISIDKKPKVKRQRIKKYYEYSQSKNDCNRFNVIWALSDVLDRTITIDEVDSFLEFSSMFTDLWSWANFLFQLNLITKRWNYNHPSEKIGWYITTDFLQDRNMTKFIKRWYPILYSRITSLKFTSDKKDNWVIDSTDFSKNNRHATRWALIGNERVEINNYRWDTYNRFTYKNIIEFIKNWNVRYFAVLYKTF